MARSNILTQEELKEFKDDDFPFENIAFEGGGTKGTAHIGAVRVLEEIGVWKNMKRFAGTSAGAMVAMCGALGYDSHDMEEKLAEGGSSKLFDATCKYLTFLPNIWRHFGWHPGKKMEKWIGEVLKEKLGNADATFEDLYNYKKNKTDPGKTELCVVVSDVNQLDCVYCHVKTTPFMPIKIAVRMSISLPGVLYPVKYNNQYYVDGGLVNNYPIRAFDGWYLSMKPKDHFLVRLMEFDDMAAAWDPKCQFGGELNKGTIGVLLYSADEKEMFKEELTKRAEEFAPEVPIPDTALARSRKKKMDEDNAARKEHEDLVCAMKAYLTLLSKYADIQKDSISKEAFKRMLEEAAGDEFTEMKAILFGPGKTNADILNSVEVDEDGQITHRAFTKYAESRGIEVINVFRGFAGKEINNLQEYFSTILDMVMLTSKRVHFERYDLTRTIGVDTGYIGTLEVDMEEDDADYMLQQGKRGCMAFLRYYKSQAEQANQAEQTEQAEQAE
ncbi:uncharacterized protein [Amphiura filiformis]|uniref:uncharacterized protein n=1 Tax=Amphiura filiformis TaxID=82378 RepID=UPI003B215CD1